MTSRGGAVWYLVGLITQRSLVQIQPPQPTKSYGYGQFGICSDCPKLSNKGNWPQFPLIIESTPADSRAPWLDSFLQLPAIFVSIKTALGRGNQTVSPKAPRFETADADP